MKKKHLISIIIVNYNGKKWLSKCFDSILKQTYQNFEIIFVDNNSIDESVSFLEKNYKNNKIKIIKNNENSGFAGGNNLGYKKSSGEFIVLLNNDTFIEQKYLENFIKAFEEIPNLGCAQSKIILMNEKERLDSCGSYWTSSSFFYHYGIFGKQNDKKFNQKMPFFSIKGASVILKKEVIERIGLFDDDFWCYYEETDLCHRLWLTGYECWYYPKPICYHANGGTSSTFKNDFIQFHNFKNKLMSFLKNFSSFNLLKILPMFLILNILLSFFWLFQGKVKHFLSIYKALFWNLINLKKTLKKRKKNQKMRIKTDKEIFQITKKNPKITYYLRLLGIKSCEK